jgi:hypothetical protein
MLAMYKKINKYKKENCKAFFKNYLKNGRKYRAQEIKTCYNFRKHLFNSGALSTSTSPVQRSKSGYIDYSYKFSFHIKTNGKILIILLSYVDSLNSLDASSLCLFLLLLLIIIIYCVWHKINIKLKIPPTIKSMFIRLY